MLVNYNISNIKKISIVYTCLLVLCVQSLKAQPDSVTANFPVPNHPRLLMTKADELVIQKNIKSNKTWQAVQQAILHQCDSLITLSPSTRDMTGIRLDTYRYCLYRAFFLSYAWRTTQEKKYFNQAEKELLAMARFSDWNPSHYLDVAELTMALAIGYDWLYQDLSPASRTEIGEAILTKGIATSYDTVHFNHYRKWLSVTNNWNQVCNTGISFGAMAIFENDPGFYSKVINRSLKSITIPMQDYGPDGAYAEGYGYWGYGTTYNVLFLSGLQSMFHSVFGLDKQQAFLKTPLYVENMVGPTGKCFNYSDVAATTSLQAAMLWFADKLKDPSVLWMEKKFLTGAHQQLPITWRFLPMLLIWGSQQNIDSIKAPAATYWSGSGRNPVGFMRSSWKDSNAIYIAMKGGSPSVTHGHMDVGSFVMDADGERWAMDFGYQDYESLESKNIDLWADKQDGQRWKIFRYNNFAHNTITINNELQRVKGFAPLAMVAKSKSFTAAVTDISTLYAGQLANAKRGIGLCNNEYVLVRDEIETLDSATIYRWSMLTPAKVTLSKNNEAVLQIGTKKLLLKVNGSIKISMKTWSTDPPAYYDAPNPGTTIVGFESVVPKNTKANFNVLLVPGKSSASFSKPIAALKDWK
ncbi:MAG: heparinase II/III family protein [Chitinophagaceae bacterium]